MNRKRLILLIPLCVVLVVALLGCISWPLTGSVGKVFRNVEALTGWRVSVQQACWVPWRLMRLTDLRVETPAGGRLFVEEVRIIPDYLSVLRGSLSTRWEFDVIRADPQSWGVQKEKVLQIASSARGVVGGFAVVRVGSTRFILDQLVVQGGLIRADARGWLNRTRELGLSVQGAVAKDVLKELELVKSDQKVESEWEPFQFQVEGTLSHPSLAYLKFLTYSLNARREKRNEPLG